MSFYLLAVLSSIVDLFVQAILETMLSSQDTETEKKKKKETRWERTPRDRERFWEMWNVSAVWAYCT